MNFYVKFYRKTLECFDTLILIGISYDTIQKGAAKLQHLHYLFLVISIREIL